MAQPRTRNLGQVIRSLEIAQDELLFHADRLDNNKAAATADEEEHHEELNVEYRRAAKFVGILANYQRARLRRKQGTAEEQADGSDPTGKLNPYIEG